MQKHLEKQVSETAAVVAQWKDTISNIEAQIQVASVAVANAKKSREIHALRATMGDAGAVAAVKHARSEQHAGEQTIGDLKISLPEAQAHLANAERAAASARRELAMLHAEKLMRARVEAASKLDEAFAAAATAYSEYSRLGAEIQSFPELNIAVGGSLSFYENVTGFRRIASALPLFFTKLFPQNWTNDAPRVPLAQSEAQFWRLSPIEPKQAA